MVDILRSSEFSLAVGVIGAIGNGIYTYTTTRKLEDAISQTVEDTNVIKEELKNILSQISKNQTPQITKDVGLSDEVNKLGTLVDDLAANQIAVANVLGYQITKKNRRSNRKTRRDKSPIKKKRRRSVSPVKEKPKKSRRKARVQISDSDSEDYSDDYSNDDSEAYSSDDSLDDYI